ncbi:MAG: hypothetical protein ACFFG0_34815 [Candidatus Thorarchaeota archaeon]
MLVEQDNPNDRWRKQGREIAEKFIAKYGSDFDPTYVSKFLEFNCIIKESCASYELLI